MTMRIPSCWPSSEWSPIQPEYVEHVNAASTVSARAAPAPVAEALAGQRAEPLNTRIDARVTVSEYVG